MKQLSVLFLILFTGSLLYAQKAENTITVKEVERIERILAHDSMEGRKTFTRGIEKAANFIAGEFQKAGLQYWDTLNGYRQQFAMVKQSSIQISGKVNDTPIPSAHMVAIGAETSLKVDETSGFKQLVLDSTSNFFRTASAIISENESTIVWVSKNYTDNFPRLSMFANRSLFSGSAPVIFVLANEKPSEFSIELKREVNESQLANIIGVIPGKTQPDEYVIFSAHYDHMGIGKPDASGDSIYNGANDDASGTTAVIMLARYFKELKNNDRTIVFVAFTAEEIGGFGSRYFSQQIDPGKVVAMFNIEMIGTESKWGKNSAYITGFERSDFGTILQKNLTGTGFKFEPDPYPEQQLFFRSDNATLAALGVPAHTISTSKMDIEPHYHKQSDEIETLDMGNMAEIIKAIALSSKSIISGTDTPSRVEL